MSVYQEVEFDFTGDGTVSRSDSVGRGGRSGPLLEQRYYFDGKRVDDGLGAALSPALADWLEIANVVYLADRLNLRECSYGRSASAEWTRTIRVKVGVRDAKFWRDSAAGAVVKEVLQFLTDDVWELEYCELSTERPARQQYLFRAVPASAEVALLSVGLDSFAGALVRRAASPEQHFVFVSGATGGLQHGRQKEQFRFFQRANRNNVTHIVVKHGLIKVAQPRDLETTQRTRGFLHLTLGCVTALACGVRALHVYENGIGAINLPFDGSQIGTQNSRPVNPVTLTLMARLASVVGEKSFKINNPSFYLTKGELCAASALEPARHVIRRTISCDRPPRQRKGKTHCGWCTSCLLRRLSLESAGLAASDPGDGYEFDLCAPAATDVGRYQFFEKMDWQARTLRRLLAAPNPWIALSGEYPMLARVASQLALTENDSDVTPKLVRLYSRYADEWEAFAANRRVTSVLRAA